MKVITYNNIKMECDNIFNLLEKVNQECNKIQ